MNKIKKSLITVSLISIISCASTINIEKINEYYNNSEEDKLESIILNPESLENQNDILTAEKYYNELKKKRIENEIKTGLDNKNIEILELIVSGDYSNYATEDQKKSAINEYKKILSIKIDKEISSAINEGDCEKLYDYANNKKDLINKTQFTKVQKYLKLYKNDDLRVKKYKIDKMNKAVRMIPKDVQQNIFIEPETYINQLVTELLKRSTDNYIKAKVIHDWICDNISYDTNDLFNNLHLPQDYVSVLKRKTAVCAGYSELFKKMADIAGFEVVIISGFSKGYGYRGNLSNTSDHAWNGIKIGNKWYLIDCTWDAGYVDRKTFIKGYSTEYLFINSRDNLYTHLPENDKYQFYFPYLTKNDFVKEPKISGKFFQYGLILKTPEISYNNKITENPFILNIQSKNRNVLLSSELRTDNGIDIEGASFIKRKGNTYDIYFSPQEINVYKGNVFARLANEINFPRKINSSHFENYYLPQIEKRILEKKYTKKIKEIFLNSYMKISENNSYYYLEDQFDINKTNTIYNIFKDIDGEIRYSSSVLNIKVQNENEVSDIKTYPETYINYTKLVNTEIIEPLRRTVKSKSTVDFRIKSTDYNYFAIVVNSEWTYFAKRNMEYLLKYVIPGNVEKITIYGSKSKKAQYKAVVSYYVE